MITSKPSTFARSAARWNASTAEESTPETRRRSSNECNGVAFDPSLERSRIRSSNVIAVPKKTNPCRPNTWMLSPRVRNASRSRAGRSTLLRRSAPEIAVRTGSVRL